MTFLQARQNKGICVKRKINQQLLFISTLAAAITLLLMAAVFYHIFQTQVMEDLRLLAHVLAQSSIVEQADEESVRITVISPEGQVVYDSNAQTDAMDNHAARPEVR